MDDASRHRDELAPPGGWAAPPSPRLAVPPPEARGLVFRTAGHALRRFGRDDVPDLFAVLHASPRIFWAWLAFASRLMPHGQLPEKLREKLILRTAWNARCRYEWGQHVDVARRVGVSLDEIVAVARGVAPTDPLERAALRACDAMCAGGLIDDTTWSVLRAQLDDARIVELLVLVGHYRMLATFLVNAGVALEPAFEKGLTALSGR